MAGTSRGSTRSRASKSSTGNPPIRSPNQMLRQDKTRNNSLIRIFSVNLKFLLGFGIISFAIALFFIYQVVNPMEKPQKPRVITPLPAPKLMDLPMFQGEHRESLYWGTYRPQNYFGVRARYIIRNGATDVAKSMAIGVDASCPKMLVIVTNRHVVDIVVDHMGDKQG
ncbi:hypothetical protein HAX54_053463 [Datura stramonium]|uniref:Mannosyl-oligosaccharide glucosidase n=1 Tax=Datura stramonium TaxID=4076 RepID=A0ABS8WS25_DATST|nr:hypothetical protein [Datura stramonium]